jgi:hypothetical protein
MPEGNGTLKFCDTCGAALTAPPSCCPDAVCLWLRGAMEWMTGFPTPTGQFVLIKIKPGA